MSPRSCLFLLLLSAGPCLGAETATSAASAARFKQTRARIDALFRERGNAALPPDPRQNPFRTAADLAQPMVAAPSSPGGPAVFVPAPASDESLLQQAAATLKVGGIVIIEGRAQLTINKETYREGSVITARVNAMPVYLRIKQITSNSIVLTLNKAELTLRF